MLKNRPIRVIKREQRAQGEAPAQAAGEGCAEPSERELKTVVSGWVREHRQRSDEFRRAFAQMLREAGMSPPSSAASRA